MRFQSVTASNGPEALKILQATDLDVMFCDIKMPGLDGIDLARVLSKFKTRPKIVFVTAYDEHAVDAFDLDATDYVMKPVRAERLSEAVRRVVTQGAPAGLQSPDDTEDETIYVLRGQVRFESGPSPDDLSAAEDWVMGTLVTKASPSGRARCRRCPRAGWR